MKKLRLCLTCIALALMMVVCSVGAFAADVMTIDLAKQYFAELSELDISTIEDGFTFTENNGIVTAVMNVDTSQLVSFWYDDTGAVQYDGFFGSSIGDADNSVSVDKNSVAANISTGLNTGFTIGTSAFNFLMVNPLSSTVIGIGFCSVALYIIKRALRVSKRM